VFQGEEITLTSDVENYIIHIKECKVLIIQVYSEDGVLKNVKVKLNIVLPNGKTKLLKGDIIKYIAIF
jgi:hypothetical protein